MGETQGKTTAQKIIETLYDQGVRHVFGIPGVHNIELYEALAGQDEVKSIVARHEQGAAFMADGYARVSGKVGVAFVITGPGLTNAYTGIAEAYWDSSPIAVFATEIQVPFIGQQKGFIHELPDQKGIIEGVVKRAVRITEPEQVEGLTREALDSAISGRQRPVYIETPLDVLPALTKDRDVSSGSKSGPNELSGADSRDVERAVSLLQQAKRPVIYVGGGIKTEEECQTLIHLAEQLGAPVVTTVKGKGGVPYDHPLFAGVSWAKEIMESDLLKNADVLLAVGTRLSARLKYGGYGDFSLPERLIHIDVDPNVINQNFPTELGICADAVKTMDAISQRIEVDEETRNEGFKRAEFAKAQVNASLLEKAPTIGRTLMKLRESLPRETIIAGDNALIGIWAARYFPIYHPRTYLFPMRYGTLGFAVPAAIGARIAKPDRPVVALVGDGGFLFSAQELAAAVQNHLDLTVIIVNDNRYGSVHYNQRKKFDRVIASELENPDFELFARSFGCNYSFIDEPLALGELVERKIHQKGVNIIEVDGSFMNWY